MIEGGSLLSLFVAAKQLHSGLGRQGTSFEFFSARKTDGECSLISAWKAAGQWGGPCCPPRAAHWCWGSFGGNCRDPSGALRSNSAEQAINRDIGDFTPTWWLAKMQYRNPNDPKSTTRSSNSMIRMEIVQAQLPPWRATVSPDAPELYDYRSLGVCLPRRSRKLVPDARVPCGASSVVVIGL